MPIMHRCLKCKEERQMTKVMFTLFKNGQPAVKGYCKKCGAKMTRFLPRLPKIEEE